MKTFFTADYHLGEDRFKIMNRPFSSQKEMIDVLIEKHNSKVSPNDLVYHLGDVCYSKTPEFLPEVAKFNGRKILIRGNHDRELTNNDLSPYFEQIVDEGDGVAIDFASSNDGKIYYYNNFYLTHYPTRCKKDMFNLCGHVHSIFKCQLNMINVGVDVNHFFPYSLDDVLFYKKAIEEFYDEDAWIAYKEVNMNYLNLRGKKGSYFP